MSAIPDVVSRLKRRDIDAFDGICDHLLVIDHAAPAELSGKRRKAAGKPKVVGTYRLLRQETAERYSGFYSAGEFDIAPLLRSHPGMRFLELGRSCVLKPYRDKRTVELLWHGIWTYVRHHRIDVMFGCASIEGTDPARLALPLSFLHHHALARPNGAPGRCPGAASAMDLMPAEAIDGKLALHALPPLIKGYLRVGRDVRRRRGRRPPVRHHRRPGDPARHRHQSALYRPFRRRRDAARRLRVARIQRPSPAALRALERLAIGRIAKPQPSSSLRRRFETRLFSP